MAENENAVVIKEVRERNDNEIQSLLASKREELHQASFKHALGQLRETHLLRTLRRDVARLTTILNERTSGSKEVSA